MTGITTVDVVDRGEFAHGAGTKDFFGSVKLGHGKIFSMAYKAESHANEYINKVERLRCDETRFILI